MQILNAAEEREKQVVGLEEELARRRRDLEHEHSTRLAEAEATVRRLQVPLSHPDIHSAMPYRVKTCCQAFKYKAITKQVSYMIRVSGMCVVMCSACKFLGT